MFIHLYTFDPVVHNTSIRSSCNYIPLFTLRNSRQLIKVHQARRKKKWLSSIIAISETSMTLFTSLNIYATSFSKIHNFLCFPSELGSCARRTLHKMGQGEEHERRKSNRRNLIANFEVLMPTEIGV